MKYRATLSLPLLILLTISMFQFASAQNEKRRAFIEGLFRSIIESQYQTPNPPGLTVPGQPIPNQPIPNQPLPGQPISPAFQPTLPPNQLNQQLSRYRSLIANYSQETNALANNLQSASARKPNLKAYLSAIYTIRSQALQMQQTCDSVTHLHTIEPQFRALDTSWRDLRYRLQHEPGLDVACTQNVQAIESYNTELGQVFGIQADFDRIQAVFIAGQATAYTSALIDLLQEQMQGQPADIGILQEGRQLVGLANQFGLNVANLSLPQATESCQEWGNAWNVFAAKLRGNYNHSLIHAISRVSTCQGELYELMRIERPIDYSYLQQMSLQTQLSIQNLFNQLSLHALSGLSPNQIQSLISAQQTVSAQMQSFQQSLQRNPNEQQITQRFIDLYNSWKSVDRYLGSLQGQAANSRAAVQAQMGQMRDFLQISDALDMSSILTRAASLEALAGNLYTVVAQRAQMIPNQIHRNQLFVQTQQFLQNTKIFHAQVANGSDLAALEKSCGTLVDSWQTCSQLIHGLPSRGVQPQIYQSIERVCLQIDPSVADLAVVLAP